MKVDVGMVLAVGYSYIIILTGLTKFKMCQYYKLEQNFRGSYKNTLIMNVHSVLMRMKLNVGMVSAVGYFSKNQHARNLKGVVLLCG